MKILFICPHLSTGGMPQYTLKMSQYLENQGNEISVIEVSNYSDTYTVQRKQFKFLIQLHDVQENLIGFIKMMNPDVVHFQEVPEVFIKPEILEKVYDSARTYKVHITSHSSNTRRHHFKYLPDGIIAVNNWQQALFKKEFPEIEITKWEYPIENKGFISKSAVRQMLGVDKLDYKRHILNVGLFTPGKNQGELFEIARKNPQNAYHFVGNQAENFKSYWEPLMKNKPDNCFIWGERADVDLFYQMADEFYFTSKFELCPLVIKEALAYLLPVKMYKLESYGNDYDNNPLVTYLSEPVSEDTISKNYNLMKEVAIDEIENHNIYEKYFAIQKGDVVVDVGAHIGIFTQKALNSADKVYAIEPDPMFLYELMNIHNSKLVVVDKAISDFTGESTIISDGNANEIGGGTTKIKTLTFKDFYISQNIDKIDFLKLDCEGGEYSIINKENIDWLSKNVKHIVGEFHIHNVNHKIKLHDALRLIKAKGFHVRIESVDGVVIHDLEKKLDYYKEVLFYVSKEPFIVENTEHFIINYNNGCFVEVNNDENKRYFVRISDSETNNEVYSTEVSSNSWVKTKQEYYTKWKVEIYCDNKLVHSSDLNLTGKKVHICLTSRSLGDTLAWMPFAEEFRKKHNCQLYVSSYHNYLFEKTYPQITFIDINSPLDNMVATYHIGWFYNNNGRIDNFKHPSDPKQSPLQKTAADILGIEYKEIKPLIPHTKKEKRGIVSIGIHSTAQAKYWNNPSGWQDVVNYINSVGKTPILLSKEQDGFMGNTNPDGAYCIPPKDTLKDIIEILTESDVFIGVGNGLSWLAWACGTPVVLISGFSEAFTEMKDCIRISAPSNVCKGCFNKYTLNKEDWHWCPVHKGTDRQYECSKTINSEVVIQKLMEIGV